MPSEASIPANRTTSVSIPERLDYRPAVVVMNMHYTGLGVARALAPAQADVWGLSFDSNFIGNASRYCKFSRYPNPADEPAEALQFLVEFAGRFDRPPLLVPTRDLDIEFVLKHRAAVESRYLLAMPATAVMERILDKSRLFSAARSIGIQCPDEVRVTTSADLRDALERLAPPWIVKPPVASRWRQRVILEAVGGRKVIVFDRRDDLLRFYEHIAPVDPELLVQEFIPGGDRALEIFGSYISRQDGSIRYFTARKILQAPPGSGTGVVVRAEPIADIAAPSIKLLRSVDYTGISEIEYKRDARTGKCALIEINPRHWDQHTAGIPVGVNLSRALYADVIGKPVPELRQDARAVSWIAEEAYLLGLPDALRGKGYPLREYLGALSGPKAWATFAWRDPKPGVRILNRVTREYARGLYHRVRRFAGKAGA